ncbi:MAG: hypothetical protein K2H45_04610 [Acetatifactor sp.]|nr:hypothetical protein [Acetatifactor sp.]
MSITNMIDLIRRRPGMFLGSNSISALRHYLQGYQAAEREYAIYRTRELFPLPFLYMHEYTGYRLRDHSNLGWSRQILDSCDGVEDVALQKFFEFYDGFIRVRMRRYWKAVLSEDNIACNNQMKRACSCSVRSGYTGFGQYKLKDMTVREPIYHNPLAAYVIELTIPVCILAVETAAEIKLERWFFSSPKTAKEGAESYFDSIDSWEEFTARNISFDKNIVA